MKRSKHRSLAAQANRYDLYQQSVQEPQADFRLIGRVFRQNFGRSARLLREDFCIRERWFTRASVVDAAFT